MNDELRQAKQELKATKRQLKLLQIQAKENTKKSNYVDHKMRFIVTTESKQILFIGKTLRAFKFYYMAKYLQLINKNSLEGIKEKLVMIKGLKNTALYLGISEDKLIQLYLEKSKRG